MTERKPHHHGDLRAALIRAGIDLVREDGANALSIRKAAARVGVSHAAPAHHFPTLAHLRTAVVAQGFRQFTRAMEDEIAKSANTARGRLLGTGRGYQSFAHSNPGLFHLMFGGFAREAEDPELQQAAKAAFDVLLRVCAAIAPGKAGDDGNALFVWALAHGLASLSLSGQGRDLVPGTPLERFEAIFPDLPMR